MFALRTRTVRNIKKDFPTQYNNNMACQVCFLHVCCQEHLLVCPELTKSVNIPIDMEYLDIYGNPEKQIKIVRIMRKLLRTREILIQWEIGRIGHVLFYSHQADEPWSTSSVKFTVYDTYICTTIDSDMCILGDIYIYNEVVIMK